MIALSADTVIRLLAFATIFGLGLWSFVAALWIGPARNLIGSPLGFLDGEDALKDASGRRLKRPNRKDLTSVDPAVRHRALESYRKRADAALAKFDAIKPRATHQAQYVIASTVLGSTLAFVAFVVANDFLFGQGQALQVSPAQNYAVAVLMLIAANADAAFTLNFFSDCIAQNRFALAGVGTVLASKGYRLVLTWSVPVIIHQVRWIWSGLQPRIDMLKVELEQIVAMTDDEDLLKHLGPYIRREASWGDWIASSWRQADAIVEPQWPLAKVEAV